MTNTNMNEIFGYLLFFSIGLVSLKNLFLFFKRIFVPIRTLSLSHALVFFSLFFYNKIVQILQTTRMKRRHSNEMSRGDQ